MGNPAANTLQNVPPSATPEVQNATTNQVIDQVNQLNRTQNFFDPQGDLIMQLSSGTDHNYAGLLLNDSNGIPLALFGKYPDGEIALKVAKSGDDVTTATDAELIFNSQQNTFKIARVVDGVFTVPAVTGVPNAFAFASNTNTIPHGLGYAPVPFGTFFDGSTYIQLPDTRLDFTASNSPSWYQYRVRVDATNIYLDSFVMTYNLTVTGPTNYAAKIYLLQETVN